MRYHRQTGWWLAGLIALAAGSQMLVAQSPRELAAANRGLIKPPTFDSDVVDLFAADGRTKIGPGKPPGDRPPPGKVPGVPSTDGDGAVAEAASGSFAWSKLISSDNLESEIKSLGSVANEAVKTQNNFKSKGREVAQGAFTELAMLFGVIAQFDGDVKWKKDALGLEKAYAQAGNNCKTSSDAAYKEARKRAEDLGELLKGGTVELPKAEGQPAWHELLNRPVLMKRLEEARAGGKIAKYISNKSEFKKGKDSLMREIQLLAVIAEVIKDPAFESAEDPAYQKYAQALQSNCLTLIEAAKNDDTDKAQAAFAQVSKSCDTCHGDFK